MNYLFYPESDSHNNTQNRLSPKISDKLIRVKIHGKGLKEKTSREFLKSGEKTVRKLKSKT